MADDIIASGASSPIPSPDNKAPLFKLSAGYLIDPASKTDDLGNDLGCLTEALTATIQAIVDATSGEDHHLDGLIFAALYQAKQVSGLSSEFVRRASEARRAPGAAPGGASCSVVAAQATPVSPATAMAQSLSDAACAANAIGAALDGIQGAVYSDLGSTEQGLYEAAIASIERLDRALSRGIEAWGVQSPELPGSTR